MFAPESRCFPPGSCPDCTYDFKSANAAETKDFGLISCGVHNLFFADMVVELKDLPIGFKFTCEHPDNLHFGFQSRKNRDWNQQTWQIEITNIECQQNHVKLWSAGSDFETSINDRIVVWIREDRRVEYYNNNIFQTSGDVIEESKFPLDFVISPPSGGVHGFLRNIGYVSDPLTGQCVKGIIVRHILSQNKF